MVGIEEALWAIEEEMTQANTKSSISDCLSPLSG